MQARRKDLVAGKSGTVLDVWDIDSSHSIVLIEISGETLVVPAVINGQTVERAAPGDFFTDYIPQGHEGAFRSTLDIPSPVTAERAMVVDQTNESLIVDERWVVKWQWSLGRSTTVAKERLLAIHSFPHTPESRGHLTWQAASGEQMLLASAQRYLPDSVDGWTWCVKWAMENIRNDWPGEVAQIAAAMHEIFAASGLAHGDLHVGQFLHTKGRYFVTDFDGDPLSNRQESWLGDVVGMLCSFLHVAAVAGLKYEAKHDVLDWADDVSETFLSSYFGHRPTLGRPDRRTLLTLMVEREQSELDYAARFLPEWTYAAQFGYEIVRGRLDEGE